MNEMKQDCLDRVLDWRGGDPSETDFKYANEELYAMRSTLNAFQRAISGVLFETNRCPVCGEHYSNHRSNCEWIAWVGRPILPCGHEAINHYVGDDGITYCRICESA